MSTERDNFLSRIKERLPRAFLPEADPEHPGSFEGYSYQADAPVPKLIEHFTTELEALAGHVHVSSDREEIISLILDILGKHDARGVLAWDLSTLNLPGLEAMLTEAGVTIEDDHIPDDQTARQERLSRLDGIVVGLTGADAGLADTGAIALISGPGRGRLASLLPPVHIAVLPAARLYPALPAFLSANPTAATKGSNLVFIAGPSRSGDIEMTLNMGVHGPKEIHVIIAT